jgi:hypothetical protein
MADLPGVLVCHRGTGGTAGIRRQEQSEAPDLLNPLPARRVPGNHMRMWRAVLEQFWPSRRMHAFDQFCR